MSLTDIGLQKKVNSLQ